MDNKEIKITLTQNDINTAYNKLSVKYEKLKNENAELEAQILKMKNFENCDYQLHITDCPIFKSGGHISCKKCPHWILQETKE